MPSAMEGGFLTAGPPGKFRKCSWSQRLISLVWHARPCELTLSALPPVSAATAPLPPQCSCPDRECFCLQAFAKIVSCLWEVLPRGPRSLPFRSPFRCLLSLPSCPSGITGPSTALLCASVGFSAFAPVPWWLVVCLPKWDRVLLGGQLGAFLVFIFLVLAHSWPQHVLNKWMDDKWMNLPAWIVSVLYRQISHSQYFAKP